MTSPRVFPLLPSPDWTAPKVQYDQKSWWVTFYGVSPALARRPGDETVCLAVTQAVWVEICGWPEPVLGFRVSLGGEFRLSGGRAMEVVQVLEGFAYFPLDAFIEVPEPRQPTGLLYLGASGDREADRAAALVAAKTWEISPGHVQTGWEVSDAMARREPGAKRGRLWELWGTYVTQVSPGVVVVVPPDVPIGRASANAVEVLVIAGHPVYTAETPPRRVIRLDPQTDAAGESILVPYVLE